jgi:uncharacterized protein YecE (DUF72 family)
MAGRILVGTASWTDPGFIERWYPKKLKAGERLGWYAHHFEMVEVNSTFYSIPDARTVERWCANTPNDFVFDVKLHQLFSFHSTPAKLLPPELQRSAKTDTKGKVIATAMLQEKMLKIFLATMSILQRDKKLGVLLLQLSPAFSPRKHQLSEIAPVLAGLKGHEVAIELRNRNWATGDQLKLTLDFLRQYHAIFVNVDAPQTDHFTVMPSEVNEVTNEAASYLRLHGRDAKAYTTGKTVATRFDYDYSKTEIEEVADRARGLAKVAREVHVVFNNNNLDYAPRAALGLRKALEQVVTVPPQTAELF